MSENLLTLGEFLVCVTVTCHYPAGTVEPDRYHLQQLTSSHSSSGIENTSSSCLSAGAHLFKTDCAIIFQETLMNCAEETQKNHCKGLHLSPQLGLHFSFSP